VSVFQVGIGFSVYRSVFKSVRICCWYFKISRYRFGIFGVSLCVKAPRADPEILLPSQYADFDRRSVAQAPDLLVTEPGGSEQVSSLDESNPGLSP